MTHPYTYVLVRRDISLAQQLVQSNHASWEAGLAFESPGHTCSMVICTVADQNELLEAAERLHRHGIEHQVFFEPDFGMGYSALCTRALTTKKERYAMSKYPLWGKEAEHEAAHVG
jgi:hypothetical protein